jgi:hypothetical protein
MLEQGDEGIQVAALAVGGISPCEVVSQASAVTQGPGSSSPVSFLLKTSNLYQMAFLSAAFANVLAHIHDHDFNQKILTPHHDVPVNSCSVKNLQTYG